jgi:hypothetical protein
VASREHLSLEIVQDRDEETFKDFQEKLAEVVILRKARDADAAAIVVTQMVTTALQSLVYQSLVRGQPVRVFSRVVQEHDLELNKFLEKARIAGVLVEFRDNASLSREFRAWLRSMPLVVR